MSTARPVKLEAKAVSINPSATIKPASLEEKLKTVVTALRERVAALSHTLEDMDKPKTDPVTRAALSKKDVLKVQHYIKSCVGPITTNKTALIHMGDYSADLLGIKINQFSEVRPPVDLRNMYIITLIYKTNTRDYYFIKKDAELLKLIDDLRKLGTIMNITEYFISKGMIDSCGHMIAPSSFWDGDRWEAKAGHGLYYDKVNDPMILDKFVEHVLPLHKDYKPDQAITVIDMGAGKGRLADKLIAAAVEKNVPIHYILVEPSLVQTKIANTSLEKYKKNKNCKVEIIQSSLEDYNSKVQADCIISSGGTINMDVVTREQAIANIKKLSAMLLPKGFFIATGQTAVLIKSKHFNAVDLSVISYSAPCPTVKGYENDAFLNAAKQRGGFFGHYQRYVCQKQSVKVVVADEKAVKHKI